MISKTGDMELPLTAMLERELFVLREKSQDFEYITSNYIERTSVLLDIFFVIRLFENFKKDEYQPSESITRVIAYVGAAHVDNIIRLLKSVIPGKLISTGKFSSPFEGEDNGFVPDFSKDSVYGAQCIKIPLQINGSVFILPEKIDQKLDEIDIKRSYAVGGDYLLNTIQKYPLIQRYRLLETDIEISDKAFQNYLSLPRYVQVQINQILIRLKDKKSDVPIDIISMLNNEEFDKDSVVEIIPAIHMSIDFAFKKKTVKKSKSVQKKKTVKKSKSLQKKKTVKKSKSVQKKKTVKKSKSVQKKKTVKKSKSLQKKTRKSLNKKY